MEYASFIASVSLLAFSMFFTPGPNNAIAMAVGTAHGFKATLPHCAAVGVGMPMMLLAVGAGLAGLFQRFPAINIWLRYAGALYLLWLAWKISGLKLSAFKARNGGPKDAAPQSAPEECAAKPETCAQAPAARSKNANGAQPLTFIQALVFQVLNPKGWLTCISAVAMFAGTDEFVWRRLGIMSVIFFILGYASLMTWGMGGAFLGRFLTSEGLRRSNYAFAGLLALSVALLFI